MDFEADAESVVSRFYAPPRASYKWSGRERGYARTAAVLRAAENLDVNNAPTVLRHKAWPIDTLCMLWGYAWAVLRCRPSERISGYVQSAPKMTGRRAEKNVQIELRQGYVTFVVSSRSMIIAIGAEPVQRSATVVTVSLMREYVLRFMPLMAINVNAAESAI